MVPVQQSFWLCSLLCSHCLPKHHSMSGVSCISFHICESCLVKETLHVQRVVLVCPRLCGFHSHRNRFGKVLDDFTPEHHIHADIAASSDAGSRVQNHNRTFMKVVLGKRSIRAGSISLVATRAMSVHVLAPDA